jgi:bifunctional DNA-binding transcriptional regulator/antitoxin component of YhaV-PrlF toxin-antitoxin module
MSNIKFVKSFSKGQITIPKEFRDAFGIEDEFWMKMFISGDKIVAEPIEQNKTSSNYQEKLLSIKGDWFAAVELENNRAEVEKRLKTFINE